MTDEKKLIDEVLYGLKVPPKQTRQNKRSMKRSEKNIKRNLYDDVLKPLGKLTGGQAKIDKNKNNKIDAEDFKILRGGAFSGKMFNLLSKDVISRAFPQTVGQKDREKQMYMEQKSKYEEPQKLSQGGGIAIKGTKFKGVF
mgnify:FL=1|tara:strand:+ start:244 stop:666 length:423 start_codon:yes stop_codon:yes gene_type:complete